MRDITRLTREHGRDMTEWENTHLGSIGVIYTDGVERVYWLDNQASKIDLENCYAKAVESIAHITNNHVLHDWDL